MTPLAPLNVGETVVEGFTMPCWCGEQRAFFSTLHLRRTCGGSGYLDCLCGGDFCVCHNHGEQECYGCEDCDLEDYDPDDVAEWP